MNWISKVVGVREHAPVLIADAATWTAWQGADEPQESYDALDGVVGATESGGRTLVPFACEGGVFELGLGNDEVVVLQHFESDDEHAFDDLRRAISEGEAAEHLAGEVEVKDGLVIGDSWADGRKFDRAKLAGNAGPVAHLAYFVPLRAGRYLVLEGVSEDEDAAWYRFAKGDPADHSPRDE